MKMNNKGRALATELWDELLSRGKKVYGFANDDMHIFSRVGGAFNMVFAKEKSKEAIIESINKGRFYASTGVYFKNINVNDNCIEVEIKNIPASIRFIGRWGKILKESLSTKSTYNYTGDEGYVRVEVIREDGAKAWTQSFKFSPVYLYIGEN